MININKLVRKKNEIQNWDIFEFESTTSTNDEIKNLFSPALTRNLIVVSNHQTKGKGRASRKWISPPRSGLYASWLLINYRGETDAIPLSIGLACIKCLQNFTNNKIFLKWPNDLIINNKKLGGILVEIYNRAVIIGIGINLLSNEQLPPSAVALNQVSANLNVDFSTLRNVILYRLTSELERILNILYKKGTYFILSEVTNYLTTPPGSLIRFAKEDESFLARVLRLNQKGELVVELENKKIITLRNGEISIGN